MIFLYHVILLLLMTTANVAYAQSSNGVKKNYLRKPQTLMIPASLQPRTSPVMTIPYKAPVEAPLILIDPGHGGDDYGTNSSGISKYHEKYLNLSTSELVRNFLLQFGYRVFMTRTDDTFISLEERTNIANQRNPVLFVSIHYNSAPNPIAEGIEVFYYRDDRNKARSNKSKLLAQSILDKTLQRTQAKSRGVKHGNLAVIRETNMAAILIEGGFMSSASEMEKIKKVSYQKSLALGIAQGIQDYLNKQGITPVASK